MTAHQKQLCWQENIYNFLITSPSAAGSDSRMASTESPDSVVYDFCVVGSGLFGSSCAKYAAEDGPTILIGPSEEAKLKVGGVTWLHRLH